MRALTHRIIRFFAALVLLAGSATPLPAVSETRVSTLVSLDVHAMLLADVLRLIATQTKQNIIADDSLGSLRVTLHLERISSARALHVLTQAYGLVAIEDQGITMVTTAKAIAARNEDEAKNDTRTSVYRLRNATTEQADKVLTSLLPQSLYSIDTANNAVVLIGEGTKIRRARAVLAAIDRETPQVRFEIKVIDISTDDKSSIGTLFGDGTNIGRTSTIFKTSAIPLGVTLNQLIVNGRAKLLATPRLTCVNNTDCSLLVGQEYPILTTTTQGLTSQQSVEYKKIGVMVSLRPTIGADGSIVAHLRPAYTGIQSTTQAGFPIISSRSVDATLRIRGDETIVLAGLLQDIDSETVTKLPILGDLPVFGGIFRNRDHLRHKDEIVFLITPHIL